ncbi:hypothetical protein, partial [Pseudomonas spelaei]
TPAGADIGTGSQPSDAARITLAGSDIGGGCRSDRLPCPSLYIEAPTNPLPSDYGFIAAPTTTKLQHCDVNPLPKETPHHG